LPANQGLAIFCGMPKSDGVPATLIKRLSRSQIYLGAELISLFQTG
jgi:hypothetical protein